MISTHINREKGLTVYTVLGEFAGLEVAQAVLSVYEKGATQHSLWDLTKADGRRLSREDAQWLAAAIARHGRIRKGGKVAIVASSDLVHSLGQLGRSVVRGEQAPFEFEVFRDSDTAMAWLGAPVRARSGERATG